MRPAARFTLFPYTTLFRSGAGGLVAEQRQQDHRVPVLAARPAAAHGGGPAHLGGDRGRRPRPPRARRGARADRERPGSDRGSGRSEEHTSELQSRGHLVCRLLLEKKKKTNNKKQQQTSANTRPR